MLRHDLDTHVVSMSKRFIKLFSFLAFNHSSSPLHTAHCIFPKSSEVRRSQSRSPPREMNLFRACNRSRRLAVRPHAVPSAVSDRRCVHSLGRRVTVTSAATAWLLVSVLPFTERERLRIVSESEVRAAVGMADMTASCTATCQDVKPCRDRRVGHPSLCHL